MKIQCLVFDQRGLDIARLAACIQTHYHTPEGRPVKVKIGQGEYVDGCPAGSLRIVDRDVDRTEAPAPELEWDRASIVDRLQ